MLLHFVDLDAVAHEHGPFEKDANATLETTDAYIAEILAARPKDSVVAVVGDHGFERVDRDVNIPVFARQIDAVGKIAPLGGLLSTTDVGVAARMRASGLLGREVPKEEILRFVPDAKAVVAAFEPKRNEGFWNGRPDQPLHIPPYEKGNHGWWPGLSDYRAGFVMEGPGVKAGRSPEMAMEAAAGRFAQVLGVKL